MTPIAVLPIESMGEGYNSRSRKEKLRKPTDIKIQNLIMPRISLPALKEGSLLASATAPQVVIPAAQTIKEDGKCICFYRQHEPALMLRRSPAVPSTYFPIGLVRCEPYNWINALMQFVLYIPLLREIFAYTPPSFRSFSEFIDQYFMDLDEKHLLSRAKSFELVRCLLGKFPQFFQSAKINLHEVIQAISRCACAFTSLDDTGFRSDWQILWDSGSELSLQKELPKDAVPPELLVALKLLFDPGMPNRVQPHLASVLRKQYFFHQANVCYDLDAFIEYRMEEGEAACYYTYLKVDGTWVQCVDERIVTLRRSTLIDLPLQRGILFHYRRVWIDRRGERI